MDELQTITQVTKAFGVSTRVLRYYEQIGLLQSRRIEGYAYRVYDEAACLRLSQIILLRKLRIPLKQIAVLLADSSAVEAIDVFAQNISELDEEISSLSTIRAILSKFVDELRKRSDIDLKSDLLNDAALASLIAPLSITIKNIKERKTMDDLNKATEQLNKLTSRDVRIVYLPPATVAAYQYEGDDPEMHVHQVMDQFVRDSNLIHIKPDLRHYGFNSPNPIDETGHHGYEVWVTIPDDMEVPEPVTKKRFAGGLYAAHMIPFGAFEEWGLLYDWVHNNESYEYNGSMDPSNMFGCFDEHLNYINHATLENTEPEGTQLDLLIPVKEKNAKA